MTASSDPAPHHWASAAAPDLDTFAQLAHEARDALPAPFADAAREVLLRIEDFGPDDMLAEMEIDDAFGLTGLYDGIPLTERSVMHQLERPDTIWLFRRPILDEWAERGNVTLGALIGHVFVHELAHHFGWSDERIAEIDRWW